MWRHLGVQKMPYCSNDEKTLQFNKIYSGVQYQFANKNSINTTHEGGRVQILNFSQNKSGRAVPRQLIFKLFWTPPTRYSL